MFTFNDIDFSELNIKVAPFERPLLAPQKISSTNIEGKAEEAFHRKTSSTYNIEVPVYLFSHTGKTLIEDLRMFAGLLDTEKPAKLIFHDEPDKSIKVIVESAEVEKKGHYAIINVSFKVIDPYWYAVEDDIFTYWSSGAKAIVRNGNAESFPHIAIMGASTSGSFTVGANDTVMTYTGPLKDTELLIFDSSLMTAYILGADGKSKTSVLNKIDVLDFPVFSKGNNDFLISANDGANLIKCTLTCNSRWK